ncbi:unnamed protein product [Phaedon cochleariae]|uniref:Pyruvate dehydrogenase E1 component subunit alpha n=1 Tax=Phaedon cochleariae TaxID=80249 RepID=A0A9N9SBF5_PHACE|nr:unnamed protein product [Phaedon cochleariae]
MNVITRCRRYLFRHPKTLVTITASQSSLAKFENHPYDLHRIDSPPVLVEVTKEDAIDIFTKMVMIRRMENAAAQLYQRKLILGFCHLYAGQEACAVGVNTIMRPGDNVITTYRCHAWAYLMGVELESIYGELLGKVTGSSRGKGGSMHLYGDNLYGGNGIVGAHIPLGTGLALAHKYKNDGGICFTVFGDGAMDQGQTHEAFNFAKLHNLPVIYILENNNYSMGTPSVRHAANTELYKRGDLIPGIRLDGMDVFATREATKFAVEYVKSEKGPILLEFATYRYFGHSMSDPGTTYRTREEIQAIRERRDCIKLLTEKLVKTEVATEEELKKIDKESSVIVEKAIQEAMKEKEPDSNELTFDIYKESKERFNLLGSHRDGNSQHRDPGRNIIAKPGPTRFPCEVAVFPGNRRKSPVRMFDGCLLELDSSRETGREAKRLRNSSCRAFSSETVQTVVSSFLFVT